MKDKEEYSEIFTTRKDVKIKTVLWPLSSTKWIDQQFKFNGKVLDFGSMRESLNYQKTLRDKGQYFGFDVDHKTIDWLKEKGFYVDFWKTKEKFDVIIATQVYEHLDNKSREEFIKKAFQLLNKNGRLILEYPHVRNLNGVNFWTDRTHQNPPAIEDEAILLRLHGFQAQAILAGVSFWPPYNFFRLIMNFLLGFHVQHNVLIVGAKS